MTCREKARNTPSGLTVESSLRTAAGSCKVPSSGSEHLVTMSNTGPIAYEVKIDAECETPHVRFDEAGIVKTTWHEPLVRISWRPGKGGQALRQEKHAVVSLGAGTAESIRTDTTVSTPGWPCSIQESTWIQVKTL